MILLVVPCAVLSALILWFGARDIERHKQERKTEYNVDSIRQAHKQLKNAEDSLHEFEDGY